MTKIKTINEKVQIDISEYHNSATGELLASELKPGSKMEIKTPTDMVTISYQTYAVIETEALEVMSRILSDADLAKVFKMTSLTQTPLNIIYNNNIPHTNETLQKYLELKSESMYIQLIRRLMKAGILYQIKGLIYGEVRVCYMLNPFISKRRQTFDKKVTTIFADFIETYCKDCKHGK